MPFLLEVPPQLQKLKNPKRVQTRKHQVYDEHAAKNPPMKPPLSGYAAVPPYLQLMT